MGYYAPYQSQYYTQLQQGYAPQMQAPVQNQQAGQNSIIWIQGEQAAKSYMVAPNTTVLLMDSESQRFYLKSSDASGMPQPLRVFEYTETTQTAKAKEPEAPAVDFSAFATRAELEAFRNEIQGMLKAGPKQTARKKEAEEDA